MLSHFILIIDVVRQVGQVVSLNNSLKFLIFSQWYNLLVPELVLKLRFLKYSYHHENKVAKIFLIPSTHISIVVENALTSFCVFVLFFKL